MGLGAYLINSFGKAQFKAGYNKSQSEYAVAASAAGNEAARNLERINHDTRSMDDIAIDDDLSSLGIMRAHDDR